MMMFMAGAGLCPLARGHPCSASMRPHHIQP